MAKRKTPKGDKVVDLKPKAEKITEEQLQELQKSISTIQQIRDKVGGIEAQKHELLHQYNVLQDNLIKLRAEFEKDYGTFDVDVRTGLINYDKDGEANKKD